MDERIIYYLAGVPVLGVIAQWLAWRLKLPSILLLLAMGMVLGIFVNPDALLDSVVGDTGGKAGQHILFPVVSLSVAIILFEGGLTLRISELREAGSAVFRLVTVGAVITWLVGALALRLLIDLDWQIALLAGAILTVTGPTVVAPMLRSIRPSRRVGSVLKWEGIVIDPVGAILAVLVLETALLAHGDGPAYGAWLLIRTALVGFIAGGVAAWFLIQVTKRYWIPDFLHGVVFLSASLGMFALSNWLQHESGLVTVTVMGVVLANQKSVTVRHVAEFKEHLQVLLISFLFIVLGSRIQIQDVLALGWGGVAFLAATLLVIRPLAVFASTIRTELDYRERIFVAFLAPRGIVAAAVSSLFALRLAGTEYAEQADALVAVTFLIIIGTVLVYGLTAAPLARALRLATPDPQGLLFAGASPWVCKLAEVLHREGVQLLLVDTNYSHVAAAQMAGLPAECTSILGEHLREDIDLSGIGRMLAVTPNDEVNALAAREFGHDFGRANVFQLSPWDASSGRRTSISGELTGRILFDKSLNHDELERRLAGDYMVKCTAITEEFSFGDFQERYRDVTVLFVIEPKGGIRVVTADDEVREVKTQLPRAGESVVALVRESEDESETASAE